MKLRALVPILVFVVVPVGVLAFVLHGLLGAEWARLGRESDGAAKLTLAASAERMRVVLDAAFDGLRRFDADDPLCKDIRTVPRGMASGFSRPERESRRGKASSIPLFKESRRAVENYILERGDAVYVCRPEENGSVTVGSVNVTALDARLAPLLPQNPSAGFAYALRRGKTLLAQSGGDVAQGRRLSSETVSAEAPGWVVAVYRIGEAHVAGSSRFAANILVLFATLAFIFAGLVAVALALSRARREAAKRSDFVSHVSHELRTPLTSVRLYAEMLRDGKVPEGKRQSYLETLVRESERLSRLVDHILDFSRLDRKSRRYSPREFDVLSRTREIVAMQESRLKDAGLEPTVAAEEGLGEAKAVLDPDSFEQVLLNLLENAARYAPESGRLAATLGKKEGRLVLSVADSGPGVPAKAAKRLFTPFFRAETGLVAKVNGFGLGLHIARSLMRGQGGDLTYAPNDPHGAVFTIVFPERT